MLNDRWSTAIWLGKLAITRDALERSWHDQFERMLELERALKTAMETP